MKNQKLNAPSAGTNSFPDKLTLKLDWCTYAAAKWACEHWHYSKRMPDPKSVKIGVWEQARFIGVIIFSRGVSGTSVSKSLGILPEETAELSRVALTEHKTPTTKLVAIAIRMLTLKNKKLRLLVSYADYNQGHFGIIYQAGNWIYVGKSARVPIFKNRFGKFIHDRACSASGFNKQFGGIRKVPKRADLEKIEQLHKWRYFMPLDKGMRDKVRLMAKPYPKASEAGDVRDHRNSGGAAPTRTLQKRH